MIIYDILGRKVKELVSTKQPAGRYEIQYSAKGGSASGGNASNLAVAFTYLSINRKSV